MKRLVTFFTVTGVDGNKLKQMIAEFGDNIPNYCQYSGGKSAKLFCVDASIDIKSIQQKYTRDTFSSFVTYQMEVDNEQYCNLYQAEPTYAYEGKPAYGLKKRYD